jgi:hypothetical protein
MVQAIAGQLLGTASSPYGALILGEVFPPSDAPPVYFDPAYTLISSIVNQTVSQSDMTAISDALNGVQKWVTDTYAPLRADPSNTPAILHASVQPLVDQMLVDVIQPLMSDDLALPAFSVFLLAAGIHLALVQEQAYTDPLHRTSGGADSPFATSVKVYAQQYHDFIGVTWPKIVTTRMNAISAVQWVLNPAPPAQPLPGAPRMDYATWNDTFDGTSEAIYAMMDPNPVGHASADRNAHGDAVLAALTAALGDPSALAANFVALVASPLPPSSAKILSLSGSAANDSIPGLYSYDLSWSTSGGVASFDTIGNVVASGSSAYRSKFPPTLPTTLTVAGPFGRPATQAVPWVNGED